MTAGLATRSVTSGSGSGTYKTRSALGGMTFGKPLSRAVSIHHIITLIRSHVISSEDRWLRLATTIPIRGEKKKRGPGRMRGGKKRKQSRTARHTHIAWRKHAH